MHLLMSVNLICTGLLGLQMLLQMLWPASCTISWPQTHLHWPSRYVKCTDLWDFAVEETSVPGTKVGEAREAGVRRQSNGKFNTLVYCLQRYCIIAARSRLLDWASNNCAISETSSCSKDLKLPFRGCLIRNCASTWGKLMHGCRVLKGIIGTCIRVYFSAGHDWFMTGYQSELCHN